ncbi:hypothetical protein BN946_scf184844.g7 [Trametes cinnabarina]|uniref:Uncharacterized protein n=1 Tax=Pycnoporus cinnabarinus TaxID=5643 RepID=A0A060SF14_PYCCI|nr:hypothetical protein BN946_scf184844.g7 [Trametes cinnabarina]
MSSTVAYVYTYDGTEGKLSSELMRVPGGCGPHLPSPPSSPCFSTAATCQAGLRTLGKDTTGAIEAVPMGHGEVVYFVQRGKGLASASADSESSDSDGESEDEKENAGVRPWSRQVRRAIRTVREVELLGRRLEEELTCVEADEEEEADCAGAPVLDGATRTTDEGTGEGGEDVPEGKDGGGASEEDDGGRGDLEMCKAHASHLNRAAEPLRCRDQAVTL